MDFSQGMFGGYGMQGMNPTMAGMTGMNMNNFGGGYNGWGVQQMSNDFGTNAGYYPNGGYNIHHQRHQYPNHNYQNRFHGQASTQRGYGRGSQGNYGPGITQSHTSRPTSRHSSQAGLKQETNEHSPIDSNKDENDIVHQHSPSEKQQDPQLQDATNAAGKESANDTTPDDKSHGIADRIASTECTTHDNPPDEQENVSAQNPDNETHRTDIVAAQGETSLDANSTNPNQNQELHDPTIPPINHTPNDPIQTGMDSANPANSQTGYDMPYSQYPNQPHLPNDYPSRGRGRGSFARGGFRGRAGYHSSDSHAVTSTEPVGQGVEGAPTGPKAWRRENTIGSVRGRGSYGSTRGGYGASAGGSKAAPEQSRASSMREDRYDMNIIFFRKIC